MWPPPPPPRPMRRHCLLPLLTSTHTSTQPFHCRQQFAVPPPPLKLSFLPVTFATRPVWVGAAATDAPARWYSIRYSNLYNLIISWHVQRGCLIKTIGSSDTSKTTKTSFRIFSRRFTCCLYSLWFNIQHSTTCTSKHVLFANFIALGFFSVLALIASTACPTMHFTFISALSMAASTFSARGI